MSQFLERLKPKRRWFQFRLRTMLLVTAVVAIIVAWPQIYRQYVRLRLTAYTGRDLRNLPDGELERVSDWLDLLVGAEELPTVLTRVLRPNYWQIHEPKEAWANGSLVVVEMHPAMANPGRSSCSLHFIDSRGRPIRRLDFNVGYRAWPQSVRFDESRPGLLCLVVETTEMCSGQTRQFYLIERDRAELLRSEQLDGTLSMGSGNLFEVLDKPPDWSNWQRLLAAEETVGQLRGLAAFWSFDNQRSLRPIDAETEQHLKEMSNSSDPWVREESIDALRLLKEKDLLPP